MPRLHASLVFSDQDLQLARVTCDGHDGPRLQEECAEGERLVLALHGRFQFRDARTRAVVGPGVGLRMRPRQPCEISHPHGGGDACLSVRGPWVRQWMDPDAATFSVSAEAYMHLQAVLARVARREPVERVQVEEALCLTVAPAEPSLREHTPNAREREIAGAIAHELALRFDERVTVEALARNVGVSAFHACRVFRRVMGTSIHQHQQEVRLRHALALVLDTRLPLAEVALEAGFANQGHLGNAFMRRYGRTPGATRKGHMPRSA
ncbi:helix-turn-helix transcriptional regulator [Pyxidicoccus fallax]|uniref:Helix-turn-helix transcriptional regulator n=1 Tax=Pyxidicoccus fallax TaxID=394095 RepID=A0A848LRB3_9BACT|nr:AraC family transcriptional regulator [Pyxidicoccus fallax]NMO20448.1 helix-turn-helix transcriptional regulator [Pyxidicoccus fallax]NPC85282.1 helix-turn-helix transcriptional regulator [Pyxidicoccus fallax]